MFEQIYWAFTILGTLVGIVVMGYMLYTAIKYRDDGEEAEDSDRPELGELPTGGGKGRKLFVSFAMSALIVISLIVWTYATLLYVENAVAQDQIGQNDDVLDVTVVGYRFGWTFAYEGGNETLRVDGQTWENVTIVGDDEADVLRLPVDEKVRLTVVSRDVFHTFGVPALRAKTDAIPGQVTRTWIEASEPGQTYLAKCYEICGSGHSYMTSPVKTMTNESFQDWYANNTGQPTWRVSEQQ